MSSSEINCLYIDNNWIDVDTNSNEKESCKTLTIEEHQVNFRLDTGDQVNILPM